MNTIFFEDIIKTDISHVGGKGASLREMTKNGILVPPGFIVTTQVFLNFIQQNNLELDIQNLLKNIDFEDLNNLQSISEKIQNLIINSHLKMNTQDDILKNFKILDSEFVAVRSSATSEDGFELSFAGQLDSFLNITEHNLIKSVKLCWASLFSPRCIVYQAQNEINMNGNAVAIVIQKMVQSEVAGVAFTAHPVSQDPSHIYIEAGYGLGEAVVSGQITPDGYTVEKKELKIIGKYISDQGRAIFKGQNGITGWVKVQDSLKNAQKLDDEQIFRLVNICREIEDYFGFLCDIEWALKKEKFYIVQCRPITVLNLQDQKPLCSTPNPANLPLH